MHFRSLCFGCCLLSPATVVMAETISASEVIKVCGMSREFEQIVKNKCKNGETPQIVEHRNIGPLNLPTTEREARRAQEQSYEVNGLKPGETDFHNIDRLTLSCGDEIEYRYFDIYHCEK